MGSDKIKGSTGKTSRREEIAWWSQISKSANDVQEEIVKFNDKMQTKKNFEEEFGLSSRRKATEKEKTKNTKKGLERIVRTETKLAAGTTRKRKVARAATDQDKFFGRKVQQNNERSYVLPSFCFRYRSNNELSMLL